MLMEVSMKESGFVHIGQQLISSLTTTCLPPWDWIRNSVLCTRTPLLPHSIGYILRLGFYHELKCGLLS